MQKENREFRMHKDILWSIIQSQAGTLSKAILELVMNSIDAGATSVEILLDTKTVSIKDNGKGFSNRKEIEDFFECFGTPHEKGDATYGRFRMGRGQIMSFGSSVWKSGNFLMDVDIKEMGLAYDLHTSAIMYNGCFIDATLYDELLPSEVIRITDELRNLCKYTPVPVFVNKTQISVDMSKEKWTFEDEDAYYLLRESSRSLEVYNLGVHVKNYYSGDYGVGGVVVSKVQLEVNFARNDILLAKCEVWKRVSKRLRDHAKQYEDKKPVQNEEYREMLLKRLLTCNFDSLDEYLTALENAKVFTDYSGKNITLASLLAACEKSSSTLVIADSHSLKADRVHQKGLALVLAPKNYERAGSMSFEAVLERFIHNIDSLAQQTPGSKKIWSIEHALDTCTKLTGCIKDLNVVSAAINDQYDLINDKDLTKEEKLVLKTIRSSSDGICYSVSNAKGIDSKPRAVKVCSSEAVDGFTDGSTTIYIERKFLKAGGSKGHIWHAFDAIKSLMLHEYLHDENDSTGHGHPPEFYEMFHELMCHDFRLQAYTSNCVQKYLRDRKEAGLKMRSGDLYAVDMADVELVQEETIEPDVSKVTPIVDKTVAPKLEIPLKMAARISPVQYKENGTLF